MIEDRTATITWGDPMLGAQAALTMSGLDYLLSLKAGAYPPAPIARTLNMDLVEVENGRAVFTALPTEYMYNPIGVVHGGYASTVLDAAMGCAVHSTLPVGMAYSTSQLSINLVRPITLSVGLLSCEGKVIHSGRMIATAEARLVDATGKLYAHATTTCAIFPVQRG
ncbi:MAG: PaaI family thioesterase [bacterium]|nr:PaaI family thioesterase [bacterium]